MSIRRFSATSISSTGGKSSKLWDQETTLGTYESIATAVVDSSNAAAVIFSNIPQNYAHLQLRYTARATRDYTGNSSDVIQLAINSGIINATKSHWLYGNGSSMTSTVNTPYVGVLTSVSGGALYTNSSNFASGIADILDYSSTTKNKTTRTFSGYDTNGGPSNGDFGVVLLASGFYDTTAAITTLGVYCLTNFVENSSFSLYGIRGA